MAKIKALNRNRQRTMSVNFSVALTSPLLVCDDLL